MAKDAARSPTTKTVNSGEAAIVEGLKRADGMDGGGDARTGDDGVRTVGSNSARAAGDEWWRRYWGCRQEDS